MSLAHKGIPLSLATRAKLSLVHKGRKLSPEHIARGVAGRTGLKRTPEQRARMSLAQRGKKISPEALINVIRANKITWEKRRTNKI